MCGTRVYNNANISVANAAWTALTFNTERFDLYDGAASTFHSTVSNTGRITIPASLGGYYIIGGHVEFATNTTGQRGIRIIHSVGATELAGEQTQAIGVNPNAVSVVTGFALNAAEYVTLEVYQSSGAALNALASANYSPEFWAIRVAV